MCGDVNAARLFIDAKADLTPEKDDKTPLGYAAQHGMLDVMKLLLDANAAVDGGTTPPLVCAVDKGNAEAVKILLDAQASLEIRDRSGRLPLSVAISKGHAHVASDKTDIMKILIDAKAPLETSDKYPPLQLAIAHGNLSAVQLLLDVKAATDVPGTKYDQVLLSGAIKASIRSKNDDILRLRLDANVSSVASRCDANTLQDVYNTNRDSALELLLERNASVDHVYVKNNPLLMEAVISCRTSMLKVMINAKANLCVKDCDGMSPLRRAVNKVKSAYNLTPLDVSIVKMLADAKASLEVEEQEEYEILKQAIVRDQYWLVKSLLDAKANLDAVSCDDRTTLLMHAVLSGSPELVKLLLSADPASFDAHPYGMTTLMVAICRRRYSPPQDARVLRMLLEQAQAHCAAESSDDPPTKRFKKM